MNVEDFPDTFLYAFEQVGSGSGELTRTLGPMPAGQAIHLRQKMYQCRKAMNREQHPDAVFANRVAISVEKINDKEALVTLYSREDKYEHFFKEAGLDVMDKYRKLEQDFEEEKDQPVQDNMPGCYIPSLEEEVQAREQQHNPHFTPSTPVPIQRPKGQKKESSSSDPQTDEIMRVLNLQNLNKEES